MKNNNTEKNCQTPIKKWQHMSPFQEDLAIIQSQSSEQLQGELFNELVGRTPSFNGEQDSFSPSEYISSDQFSHSQSFPSEQEKDSEHSHTVNEMKHNQENTSQKVIIKSVDTNRKGCNCRNSKCQKNYCDCLKMGLVCAEGLCSCEDCHNTEEKEIHKENKKMIEVQSKITRKCTCKKSRCLKKYCQCHSNGKKCSSLCQCIDCSNRDENERPPYQTLKKMRKTTNILGDKGKIAY